MPEPSDPESPFEPKTDAEWREQLTEEQFRVTRQAGTEAPFSGEYCATEDDGTYRCVCCGLPLFRSDSKFDAGCGWPSFFEPLEGANLVEVRDESRGMTRIEIRCNRCDAHLGHVFPDGPPPTGLRYCINSASLNLAPKRPDEPNPIGWIALLVIFALILIGLQWTRPDPVQVERAGPSMEMVSAGRWTIMLRQLELMSGESGLASQTVDALKQVEVDDADRLRRSILRAEVEDAKSALLVIEAVAPDEPSREVLARRYGGEKLTSREQARLEQQHGWFGRLSGIYDLSDEDPERIAFLAPFVRAAKFFLVVPLAVLAAFLAGFVLLFVFIRRCTRGEMEMHFRLHDAGAGDRPWLQIVVLFLGLALIATVGVFGKLGVPEQVTMWLLALPIFWPLFRGVSLDEWRGALGLRGGWREIGAGLVGYMAGLPVIALGFWMTSVLVRVTGIDADHPIQYELEGGSTAMIIIGAIVWAPLVEELVFRGAFYRYLRPRFTVVGATLLSALLFSALHPQGLTGIPAIMSIGIVLAVIREWRGSTIATMTMHAVHNGVLVTVMLTLFSN